MSVILTIHNHFESNKYENINWKETFDIHHLLRFHYQ